MKFLNMNRWVFLSAVLGVAACATVLGVRRPKNPGEEIRQSHETHKDFPCDTCHEKAIEAKVVSAEMLPKESKCLECHSDKKEAKECGFCHRDPDHPATYPNQANRLIVSHAAHAERTKKDCTACHVKLSDLKRPERTVPPMDACMKCHNHSADFDAGRCGLCHVDLTRYPIKPVAEFSHGGNFVKTHGMAARTSSESCTQCHDQSFCADCHAKTVGTRIELKFPEDVERNFIHRAGWETIHSIEARHDQSMCQRCHGTSYCNNCHSAQNVGAAGKNPRSPHPAGWAYPGPQSHAGPARREIVNCASCHDQGAQSNCVGCHRVGGIGGNPHPASWQSKHNMGEAGTTVMCRICHQ